MTTMEATAEVFWMAFRALRKKDRAAFIQRLLQDEEVQDDLRYAVIIEERKREPRVSLHNYLSQRAKKQRYCPTRSF